MKILQLCVRFPPAPGGAESHVLAISRELLRRGHEVQVFTSNLYREVPFDPRSDWEEEVEGVPVRRFGAFSPGGDMHYVFIPGMARAALKAECDIVHAHSYGYFQTAVAALRRRLSGTPFVFTPHFHPKWSMWGGDRRKALRGLYDGLLGGCVFSSADAVIGVSRHEMEQADSAGCPPDRVHIIPNGIDMSRFTPVPDGARFRERYNIRGRMVLYAGRLASNKGLDHLLRAVPDVLDQSGDTTFVLAGEDEGLRPKLEALATELGIGGHVLFTGHIQEDGLFRSAYGACDLFVLPSEYEAFGIVLLEAGACEKPCVATRVGGVPEVVEDQKSGLLVDFGDPAGLAEAMNSLLADDGRRAGMGVYARRRVASLFTWESVAERIEGVYSGLLLQS